MNANMFQLPQENTVYFSGRVMLLKEQSDIFLLLKMFQAFKPDIVVGN